MKPSHLIMLSCAALYATSAQAEIYKKVDEDGHVTYSSAPIKGAKKLHLEPLPTMAPPPKVAPNNFPRVNEETQSRRDDTRRKILEDELTSEQQALVDAQRALQDAKDNPEVSKGPSGQTFRNVAKYEEKVNTAEEQVRAHEKNIEALKAELSNLK